MQNKMLIDAGHPEETRVIVLRGNRVEEFDFEAASKKQLRGNIYLAKVTRVEPSLQAAFIEYGGNRHGFLAFSEIHPDYYQIPVADRQALLEEEARGERADADDEGRSNDVRRRGRRRHGSEAVKRRNDDSITSAGEDAAGALPSSIDSAPHSDALEASHAATPGETFDTADAHGEPAHTDTSHAETRSDETSIHAETTQTGSLHAGPVAHHEASDHEAPDHDGSHHGEIEAVGEGVDATLARSAPETNLHAVDAAEPGHAAERPHGDAPAHAADESVDGSFPHANDDAPADKQSHAQLEDTAAQGATAAAGAHESAEGAADHDESPEPIHADHGTNGRATPAPQDDDEDDEEDEEDDEDGDNEAQHVEQLGGDAMEELPSRPFRPRRHYKIQEVIKRRQVLLVQVVKEERGTKGAALTTYLSLAGRYSVLMPNTARGGGISRKITDSVDRKRLKSIAEELEVPEGMGIILRTAGASRTKIEVKRDFEYLLRMWETVREVTLKSSAPTLVYEEGSLIKRAIRDLYSKDIEEILVAGEDGYREAKEFMRMLMPSHAKTVQLYREAQPIFTHAGAEAQLDGMYSNQVTLRSGGYIVINQTEALVAIDVNSGRSTREHNIEDTALRTNLEAADEVARQLRLRDLAGLIVVDFIDMEERRNNSAVERRMKDALKNDRARIQIGRISHFGLLEMSRQRIRTGVLEGSTVPCPHCMGAGMVRSTSSVALHVLRGLEDALIKSPSFNVTVKTRTEVALYILNQKRAHLREIELRFGVAITVTADTTLSGVAYYTTERGELATPLADLRPRRDLVQIDTVQPIFEDDAADFEEEDGEAETGETEAGEDGGEAIEDGEGSLAIGAEAGALEADGDVRRRRRRRRRRGGRDREQDGQEAAAIDAPQPSDDGLEAVVDITEPHLHANSALPADLAGGHGLETHAADAPLSNLLSEDGGDEGLAGDETSNGDPARPASRRRRRSRRGEGRRTPLREGEAVQAAGQDGLATSVDETDHGVVEPMAPTAPELSSADAMHVAPSGHSDDQPQDHQDHQSHQEATTAASGSHEQHSDQHHPAPSPHDEGMQSSAPSEAGSPERGTSLADLDTLVAVSAGVPAAALQEPTVASQEPAAPEQVDDPTRPKRSGWWQRAKATFGG